MPRYFFDVRDGEFFPDDTGTELADLNAARAEAVVFSGRLLADLGSRFWDTGDWNISVRDESGLVLFSLLFAATNAAATLEQDRAWATAPLLPA